PGAPVAFLPCRAADVVPDPVLRRRGHPPSPQGPRVVLAQAQAGPAGAPGPRLPEEGRDVRRGGGRVRGRRGYGLAVRGRGRGAARGPRAEAPPGGAGREKG